jgi:hypothetical protein
LGTSSNRAFRAGPLRISTSIATLAASLIWIKAAQLISIDICLCPEERPNPVISLEDCIGVELRALGFNIEEDGVAKITGSMTISASRTFDTDCLLLEIKLPNGDLPVEQPTKF